MVSVQGDDGKGGTTKQSMQISITNVNEAPTAITLDSAFVYENQPAGTTVGRFTANDPDAGDSITYTLVDSDSSFYLDSRSLKTSVVFDYEVKNSYPINVKATDSGGLTFTQSFTISISNANDTPGGITLSNTTVMRKSAAGTAVGNLSATDQDAGDSLTFSLAAGDGDTDNSLFTLAGNQLLTSSLFETSDKGSLSIRVQVTDPAGAGTVNVFTITAPAPNTPPTANSEYINTVKNITVAIDALTNDSDPDGDNLTITNITQGVDSEVFGSAVINQGGKTISYTPNTDVTGMETFQYTISDGRGGSASANITVIIEDSHSGFPFIAVTIPTNMNAVVNTPVTLTAKPSGGDGTYLFEWIVKSQPNGANDAASLTAPKSDTTIFTPSKTGEYVLTVTLNDEVQVPAIQDVTLMVYNPLTVDAGADQTAPLGRTIVLNANVQGGTGNYKIAWSILKGPDTSLDQIPGNQSEAINLRLVSVGVYQFQILVTDEIQPAISDTVTVTISDQTPVNSWQLY